MNEEYNKINIKLFSIIAYLGPLFLAGKLSVEKDEPFVKFHCEQGYRLFIFEIIIFILIFVISLILSPFSAAYEVASTLMLIGAVVISLIMTIMGIYSAVKKQTTPLPFIGELGKKSK